MIDNEFMYMFAKRLALDARELSGRSYVGVVLRCYLPANVSYWPGCVVVRDSDSFVDSFHRLTVTSLLPLNLSCLCSKPRV